MARDLLAAWPMRWRAIWAVAILGACGGGPRLEGKTVATRTFRGAQRCGQHLAEARFVATGGRHGEAVELRSCGERALALTMELEVRTTGGPLSFGGRSGDRADNQRCLLGPPAPAATAVSRGGDEAKAPAAAAAKTTRAAPASASLVEVASSRATRDECFATSSLELQTPTLVAGSEIVVKLWSAQPSDLDGALIQLRHLELHPNVSEKEWAEHVAREAEAPAAARAAEPAVSQPRGPPPAPRAERPSPRPAPDAVWIPGYWSFSDGAWAWVGGAWKSEDAAARRPPPPRRELRPPRPAAAAVWIGGAWFWNGVRFVWAPGRWTSSSRRPR